MKILVTGELPAGVLDTLTKEHDVDAHGEDRPMQREQLLHRVSNKEGLLCMITDRIDRELMDRAPGLKMIANFGVGYNNIDVKEATSRGIPVSNTPGVLTEATADATLALILGVSRRIVEGDRMTREGRFQFWAPFYFLGSEVSGKTLGIIGLGRIGKAVAQRARGFEMRILYYMRNRMAADEEKELGVEYAPLNGLLPQSDFVSLHVPLTDQTRHFIDRKALGLMKPEAFLINTSRGPVVDELALVKALQKGRIAGAGLDVYENEPALAPGLVELENVILLPHVGSATRETRTRMAQKAAENLLAGLRGAVPPNCINGESLSKKNPERS